MSLGSANEVIRGANASLKIGTNTYNLKKTVNFSDDTTVHEDSTSVGYVRHEGQRNIHGNAEIYASQSDIGTIFGYANQNATGGKTVYPIEYKLSALNGSVDTITAQATISNPNIIDTDPEDKVTIGITINVIGNFTI